jgi:tryptophan halogenase
MPNKPQNQLEVFDWALHFDAALFARLMRETAETLGVNRVEAKVKSVQKSKEDIGALILESGELISGDLFIDCSGFKAELIGKALEVDYLDWSNYLLCDSAIAVQTEKAGEISNKTISKAKSAGWQWRIPLTTRMGNGYVYSSKHINDEDAELEFLSSLEGDMTSALRRFKFTPGRRANAWQSNCVSIGLSSGFLEPLESTSIALIETAIAKLIDLIPDNQISSDTAKKFNYATALEYERVRDFIIMHYVLSQRDDTQFWLDCRDVSIPETLKLKLQNYEQNAELKPLPWDIFGKDSWLALLDGLGMYPSKYNERANNMPIEYLQKHLAFMKQEIDNLVGKGVEHERFLREEINLNE